MQLSLPGRTKWCRIPRHPPEEGGGHKGATGPPLGHRRTFAKKSILKQFWLFMERFCKQTPLGAYTRMGGQKKNSILSLSGRTKLCRIPRHPRGEGGGTGGAQGGHRGLRRHLRKLSSLMHFWLFLERFCMERRAEVEVAFLSAGAGHKRTNRTPPRPTKPDRNRERRDDGRHPSPSPFALVNFTM